MKRALPGVAAAFLVHAWWLNCVAEDAFITYRFARNVAEGHGFVWNIGEAPVEGFTNFLWLLVSAVAYRLGLDVPLFTQALGLTSGLIALVYVWRLSAAVFRQSPWVALFTTALLAAAGPFATWATSGMETVFFALMATMAVFYASQIPSPRTTAVTAACLLLATLTRPEGFGLFLLVLVGECVVWLSGRDRRRPGHLWLLAAVYVPVFLAYFAWRYHTFGYPLPNTFYAKTGGGLSQVRRGLTYIVYFVLHFVTPCLPWVVLAAWRLGERDPRPEGAAIVRGDEERRRGLMIGGTVVAGYLGYVALVGGDYMAMYRFVVPVLPLMTSLFGVVVDRAVRDARLPPSRRAVVAALAIATIGGVLLQSTPYETAIFAPTPLMHGTYRGVSVERWHVNRFHVIGDFLRSRARSGDDSLLTYDIGVVGYVTRLKIYDALGIVDPVVAHAHVATPGTGLAGHEKQDLAYSYSRAPALVMYTVQLRPQPAPWPAYPPDLAAHVQSAYDLKSVWLIDARNHEQGYFTFLERKADGASGDDVAHPTVR